MAGVEPPSAAAAAPATRDPTSRRVYLDYAATAPVSEVAAAATMRAWQLTGNPSSAHASGRATRRVLEDARETIAATFGARPRDVVLTSGGTEADNLAVHGQVHARQREDPRRRVVCVSAVEHDAVLEAARALEAAGHAQVAELPVDDGGRLDVDAAEAVIRADPDGIALVCVMAVNNETGTIQPVSHVAAIAAEHGIPVHCDAAQAAGRLPIDLGASPVTSLAVSGHKLGAPVGVGALLVPESVGLLPQSYGGGQERGLRSGTLDAAGAAGLAAALVETCEQMPATQAQLRLVAATFVDGLAGLAVVARRVGAPAHDSVPAIHSVAFPGCRGEDLVMLLDLAGFDVSSGSACSTGVAAASHVMRAMGLTDDEARSVVRFSFGPPTTGRDVDAVLAALPRAVEQALQAGAATSHQTTSGSTSATARTST